MRRVLGMGLVAVGVLAPRVADACGGCFHQEETTTTGGTDSTVVTSHRMAMTISPDRSVLWDQIQFAGNPEEFSWVLPVKPGAELELASPAWFDVLEAGTQVAVAGRTVVCSFDNGGGPGPGPAFGGGSSGFDCGCSSADASGGDLSADGAGGGESSVTAPPPDPVTVVSQETVGPYETVTLSTEEPGALQDWLVGHGYVIPEEIEPVINDYVAEGFDFIAMRLVPGAGVQQMQPVRVLMPGSQVTLPLRLVAAGTGAMTAVTLFVIGEGRYATQNFPNVMIDRTETVWDYADSSSNYSLLRAAALSQGDGENWLTSYARAKPFFSSFADEASETGGTLTYSGRPTLGGAYLGIAGGPECLQEYQRAQDQNLVVVDNCDDEGNCTQVEVGEVGHESLVCAPEADDLAVALTGLHVGDVWLTRLDANLPRTAFDRDLVLEASGNQSGVAHRFFASQTANHPCPDNVSSAGIAGLLRRRLPGGLVGLVLGALGA
ncbi:MAG: DUF2330 domain-containing protein, partial [Myxococcales bacterium]|nr:DUF2330 domain-containing protein [Myxococcales bacterium]